MVERRVRRAATQIVSTPPASEATAGAIAQRAYELFLARGRAHGRDLDDWLEAERQLRTITPVSTAAALPKRRLR